MFWLDRRGPALQTQKSVTEWLTEWWSCTIGRRVLEFPHWLLLFQNEKAGNSPLCKWVRPARRVRLTKLGPSCQTRRSSSKMKGFSAVACAYFSLKMFSEVDFGGLFRRNNRNFTSRPPCCFPFETASREPGTNQVHSTREYVTAWMASWVEQCVPCVLAGPGGHVSLDLTLQIWPLTICATI